MTAQSVSAARSKAARRGARKRTEKHVRRVTRDLGRTNAIPPSHYAKSLNHDRRRGTAGR